MSNDINAAWADSDQIGAQPTQVNQSLPVDAEIDTRTAPTEY